VHLLHSLVQLEASRFSSIEGVFGVECLGQALVSRH
jgi:hypothetical protein